MRADVFLDTNVLLYAISKSPAEASKATVANQLIASTNFGLSVQVCQEFYVAATRKLRSRLRQARCWTFCGY
jgi:predicted nucleic acid-binding protein